MFDSIRQFLGLNSEQPIVSPEQYVKQSNPLEFMSSVLAHNPESDDNLSQADRDRILFRNLDDNIANHRWNIQEELSKPNPAVDEITGWVGNFAKDIFHSINRSVAGLASFAGNNLYVKPVNKINKFLGNNQQLPEVDLVRDSYNLLSQHMPKAAEVVKDFYGLDDKEVPTKIKDIGKDWADMLGIKNQNAHVPIGLAMAGLDIFTGGEGSASEHAVARFIKKVAKDENEIKHMTKLLLGDLKVSEKEVERIAKRFHDVKSKPLNDIIKTIKDEGKKISGGDLFKFKKPQDFIKQLEEQSVKLNNKIFTPSKINELAPELERLGVPTTKVDDFSRATVAVDNPKIKDITAKIIDDIPTEDLAKLKKIFNFENFSDVPEDTYQEIIRYVVRNKDEFINTKFKNKGRVKSLFIELEKELPAGVTIDDLKSTFDSVSEELVSLQKKAAHSFVKNINSSDSKELAKSANLLSESGSFIGQSLEAQKRLGQEFANEESKRIAKVMKLMKREGFTEEQVTKVLDNALEVSGKKTFAEVPTKTYFEEISKVKGFELGKFLEGYRYTNLLSGFRTQLKNLFSNTAENYIFNPVLDVLETTAEKLKLPGVEKRGRTYGEVAKGFSELFKKKNLDEAIQEFKDIFNGVEDFSNTDLPKVPTTIKVGKRDLFRDYTFPLRILSAADGFTYRLKYNSELKKLLYREERKLGKKILSGSREYKKIAKTADTTARDAIFHHTSATKDQGLISKALGGVADAVNKMDARTSENLKGVHAIKFLIPFVNTTSRITAKSLRRTPIIGALELIGSNNKARVYADQAFGLMLTAIGYKLAGNNAERVKFGRGKKNDKSTRFEDKEGNAYYSYNVGDNNWVDTDVIQTISIPLFLGALLRKAEDGGKFRNEKTFEKDLNEFMTEASKLLASSLQNKFTKGIGDTAQLLLSGDNEGAIGNVSSNIVRQLVPYSALGGSFNRAFINQRRVAGPQSLKEGLRHGLNKDYNPNALPELTDPSGIPLKYDKGVLPFVDPFMTGKRNDLIHEKSILEKRNESKNESNREALQRNDGKYQKEWQRELTRKYFDGTLTDKEKNKLKALPKKRQEELIKEYHRREKENYMAAYELFMKGEGGNNPYVQELQKNKQLRVSVEQDYKKKMEKYAKDLIKIYYTNKDELTEEQVKYLKSLSRGAVNYLKNWYNKYYNK